MPLAIQPQDFSQRVTDVNRETWTLGTMRSVIKALNGAEVTIVTDKATGSATVGTLIKCFDGGPARGPRVTVETEYAPGERRSTDYWLPHYATRHQSTQPSLSPHLDRQGNGIGHGRHPDQVLRRRTGTRTTGHG